MNTNTRPSPPHVEQLVAGSKRGDAAAFDQLVQLYKQSIHAFVARRLSDPIEAEDIAQETFVRAYLAMPTFRKGSSFHIWLRCIAGNLTIDSLRRRQRGATTYSLDAPVEIEGTPLAREFAASACYEPHKTLETTELQREVHRAIRDLSPKLRAVVVLHELQGLNYGEIAATVGCPIGTVKSRMFKARGQLKRNLQRPDSRQLMAANFGMPEGAVLA
jgi:RNA polymerase sigma-70 factor, ECF subfamily